jgi:hypothetical protein
MNPTVKRVWKIITVLMGLAVVAAPDILGLSAWLATKGAPWAVYAGKAVAAVYLLVTNWERIKARIEPLVSQAEKQQATVTEIRPKDGGRVSLMMLVMIAALAAVITYAATAKADTCPQTSVCSGKWSAQPAAAAGWVVNLKTGEPVSAVSLLGVSLVRNGGIPLGVGIYGGSLFTTSAARPTLAVLFSVANFGAIGPGVVMSKDGDRAVYQMTLNLALNLNFGGSPAYVQAVAK